MRRGENRLGQTMLRFGFPCLLDQLRWETRRLHHLMPLLHPHCPGSHSPAPSSFLSNVWPISMTSLFIKVSSLSGPAASLIHFFAPSYQESQAVVSGVEGGQWNDYSMFWLLWLVPSMHVFLLGSGMSAISSDIYVRFMTWSQKRHFWVGCFPAEWFWPWSSPELFSSSPRNIAGWLYPSAAWLLGSARYHNGGRLQRLSEAFNLGAVFLRVTARRQKTPSISSCQRLLPMFAFQSMVASLSVMISVRRFKIILKAECVWGWWIPSPCWLYYSCSYLSLWCVIWFVSGDACFTVIRRSALKIPWCALVENAQSMFILGFGTKAIFFFLRNKKCSGKVLSGNSREGK